MSNRQPARRRASGWGLYVWMLAAAALLTYAPAVWGLCEGVEACLRTIEDGQRATRALSARFQQTKHLSLLAEPLVSTGRFAFKAPNHVLWQIDEPKVTIEIDGTGVHLPDVPNAEGEMAALAQFGAMMREMSGMFTGSLTGMQKSFAVTASSDAAAIRVHLAPRREEWQRMFRGVDLTFTAPDLLMHTIHIDEALGDSLDIVFSDVHRNDDTAEAALGAGAQGR